MLKVLVQGCEPTKGSKFSAAVDLYASEDVVIGAGETVKVPLGVCIDEFELSSIIFSRFPELDYKGNDRYYNEFMKSHYLQLEPRSSPRAKGLIARTGIIDLDYKDEIMIILHNPVYKVDTYYQDGTIQLGCSNGGTHFKISKGDKIAQILLKEHKTYLMGVESDEERVGGFGSTGK